MSLINHSIDPLEKIEKGDYKFHSNFKSNFDDFLIKHLNTFFVSSYGKIITLFLILSITALFISIEELSKASPLPIRDFSIGYIVSFIFYLLIQFIPEAKNKYSDISRLAQELIKIDLNLKDLFESLQTEVLEKHSNLEPYKDKVNSFSFLGCARFLKSSDEPISHKMKIISKVSGTRPNLKFDYLNTYQVCFEKAVRIKKHINEFDTLLSRLNYQDEEVYKIIRSLVTTSEWFHQQLQADYMKEEFHSILLSKIDSTKENLDKLKICFEQMGGTFT